MAQESGTSKVEVLLEWRNASSDDEAQTAHITVFRDMVPLPEIQDIPDLITDLFVEDIHISVEWRVTEFEVPHRGMKGCDGAAERFLSDAFVFHWIEKTKSGWSPLPPMTEERILYATVNVGNSGVLVIGGVGRNYVDFRFTELLTR
ncbi:hypothetical protein ACTXT7_017038 [Hymenolepis weldensis]